MVCFLASGHVTPEVTCWNPIPSAGLAILGLMRIFASFLFSIAIEKIILALPIHPCSNLEPHNPSTLVQPVKLKSLRNSNIGYMLPSQLALRETSKEETEPPNKVLKARNHVPNVEM